MSLTVREVQAALEESTGRRYSRDVIRLWVRAGKLTRVPSPSRVILVDEASLKPYLKVKRRFSWLRRNAV